MDESGRPSFNRLQNFSANADAITFFAFDLLMWKGENLQRQPLEKRRMLLRGSAMPKMPAAHFSDSFQVTADQMVSAVRSQGLEGVVAKRRTSFYEPGRRSGAWVKMPIGGGQEFVIGGYTRSSKNFDALLVGYYDAGKLMFAAKVRNGFVTNAAGRYLSGPVAYRRLGSGKPLLSFDDNCQPFSVLATAPHRL